MGSSPHGRGALSPWKSPALFDARAPVETNSQVAGFGTFDFGLSVPSNEKQGNLLASGESLALVFTIAGTGPYTTADFDVLNELDMEVAAKFVSGPGDRSAFGATGVIPEPGTAGLLATGLLGMALAGRRRR